MLQRSIFVLISMLFAVPLLSSAVAFGETGSGSTGTTTTTSTAPTTEKEAEDPPETEVQKTEREDRINKLRDEQKIKLATVEKKKIQDKCKASQGKVSSVKGRIKGIETSRGEVHKNVIEHLNTLVTKLKAK